MVDLQRNYNTAVLKATLFNLDTLGVSLWLTTQINNHKQLLQSGNTFIGLYMGMFAHSGEI